MCHIYIQLTKPMCFYIKLNIQYLALSYIHIMAEEQWLINQYEACGKVLKDKQVFDLFLREIQLLPKDMFEVDVTFGKIYIFFDLDRYQQTLQPQHQKEIQMLRTKINTDIPSSYVLKINKSFPLDQSVRLHLLQGGFQPKISDCRDFFKSVMGKPYNYSIHFADILPLLVQFDKTLHHKNELFLEMQKIGQFTLGETYFYHQLMEYFSSLVLLKDLSSQKKNNIYVGVSQTHLLIFKQITDQIGLSSVFPSLRHHNSAIAINQKQLNPKSEGTLNQLMLVNCAEMQCIDTIYYNESDKVIRLVLKKYKKIKNYHQSDEIKKQYKFSNPEIFLRAVLKYIAKFQHCEVVFEPYISAKNGKIRRSNTVSGSPQKEEDVIVGRVQQCLQLQTQIKKQTDPQRQKAKIDLINRLYQKLIEYYSARANPYYLIYVDKLNNLYTKYYLTRKNTPVEEKRTEQGPAQLQSSKNTVKDV